MPDKLFDESIFLRVMQLKKGTIQYTDATNAYRLVKEHGRDIRYSPAWKKWIVWNGKQWEVDEGGSLVHEKGLETVRNIYDELTKTDDYREMIEIEKFGKISESFRRREAMIKTAQCIKQLNIKADELDANPWALNVLNGTYDVQDGKFNEHRQEDMITKIANVGYDPAADCPMWKKFIREIMNYKTELITFLQTATGWALTGDNSEQVMFILYGSGANGKSTFLNTLMYVLGDYAIATPTETFMKKSGDQNTNDLARLGLYPVRYTQLSGVL